MTAAMMGGTLLILGAFFTYKGQIYRAIFTYFFADICWVLISISAHDYIGAIMISIGMSLGIGAFVKMNRGKMRKTLDL